MANLFPAPNRKNYIPAIYEPDEDGVMDVGYTVGKLTDGRPYRIECWRMDELMMCTIFFSSMGIEYLSKVGMGYFMEIENIIDFKNKKRMLQSHITTDDGGNAVWAVNVTLANPKGVHAKIVGSLRSYRL